MPDVYPYRHRGTAIVVGASPDVFVDLEAALRLRPDATVLGVNFTAIVSPRISHVWTQHAERAIDIKARVGRPLTLHARPRDFIRPDGRWCQPAPWDQWCAVDFAWPNLQWVDGGGGISAALWASWGMQFDEVILAGCPLELGNGGIVAGYPDVPFADASIARWQAKTRVHAAAGLTYRIRSMSGWTRETFGAPT